MCTPLLVEVALPSELLPMTLHWSVAPRSTLRTVKLASVCPASGVPFTSQTYPNVGGGAPPHAPGLHATVLPTAASCSIVGPPSGGTGALPGTYMGSLAFASALPKRLLAVTAHVSECPRSSAGAASVS